MPSLVSAIAQPIGVASLILCLTLLTTTSSQAQATLAESGKKRSSEGQGAFAVVELFTSQGCNSCPPADRNLAELASQAEESGQPIYTLSYHVDYWNYLGWEDPFSLEAATIRQRQYAGVFKSEQVYTPQIVVNGSTEFVGSHKHKLTPAVKRALQRNNKSKIQLEASLSDGRLTASWTTQGAGQGDIVVVALVQNQGQRQVTAGENANRKLEHVNIVRDFQAMDIHEAKSSVELEMPTDFDVNGFHVVAFIQSRMNATITAANQAQISE